MTRARDLAAFVSNADGDIKFDTDTLFIDSSENRVGIGTTSPSEELHIATTGGATAGIQIGTAGGTVDRDYKIIVSSSAGSLFIQDTTASVNRIALNSSGNVGVGLASNIGATLHVDPATNVTTAHGSPLIKVGGANSWAGAGSLYSIGLGYVNADTNKSPTEIGVATTSGAGFTKGDLVFATRDVTTDTAPTERMRILAAGGLTFNGDTAAGNALDDYEEGTWNPSLVGAGGGTKAGLGSYVKIGKTITLSCTFNNIGTGLSGNTTITGLPYAINPQGTVAADMYIPIQYFNLNWNNSAVAAYGYVQDGTSEIVPYYSLDGASSAIVQGSDFSSNTFLRFVQTLETA